MENAKTIEIINQLRLNVEARKPLTVTLANGFSFQISGIIGTMADLGGQKDCNLTTIVGNFSPTALMQANDQIIEAVHKSLEQFAKTNPAAVISATLGFMLRKAEEEMSPEDLLSTHLASQMSTSGKPKGMADFAKIVAQMMQDDEPGRKAY
jgi:hypothetical protein